MCSTLALTGALISEADQEGKSSGDSKTEDPEQQSEGILTLSSLEAPTVINKSLTCASY